MACIRIDCTYALLFACLRIALHCLLYVRVGAPRSESSLQNAPFPGLKSRCVQSIGRCCAKLLRSTCTWTDTTWHGVHTTYILDVGRAIFLLSHQRCDFIACCARSVTINEFTAHSVPREWRRQKIGRVILHRVRGNLGEAHSLLAFALNAVRHSTWCQRN